MDVIQGKLKKTPDDYFNKDDNIHKSETLKRLDKRTLTLLECHN